MNRRVKVWLIALVVLLMGLLFILFPISISSLRPGITIRQFQIDTLLALEEKALQNGEYPVGAMVIYKDSIIGTGFNTFRERNEPMGHAEINAIEDVFQSMSYLDFRALSRDSLVLITSYEPCPMCKGVINHLDIRKIYYIQPKRIRYRFKYGLEDLSFYLKIRKIKLPKNQ
jgi:tRNA(Arg) A34 adenosine deaminase TadA